MSMCIVFVWLNLAMTGMAVNFELVAIVAVAAAVGYAFKASAEETKKEQDALDQMTASAVGSGGCPSLNSCQSTPRSASNSGDM